MKEVKLDMRLTVYEDIDELSPNIISLFEKAGKAREKAYAPYSNFLVGAAVLLENGEIITSNNQENASYPTGLCAERTAIFYAGSQYPGVNIKVITVTAGPKDGDSEFPVPPCGGCRQAISEYEIHQKTPIEIYFMGLKGKVMKSDSLANLLPFAFDRSML